jgi:hypothetical protein
VAPLRYYKTPSQLCSPCSQQLWILLPIFCAFLIALPLLSWLCCLPVLKNLVTVLERHQLALMLLSRQFARLSLLNRLSLVPFPAELRWLFGVAGLLVGFNTVAVGADCAIPWGFGQQYWLVVGGAWAWLLLVFVGVDLLYMAPLNVPFRQWRVWDAASFLAPYVVQASWQALAYKVVGTEQRLLTEPSTLLLAQPHLSAYSMSIFNIACCGLYLLFRHILPCASWGGPWTLSFKRFNKSVLSSRAAQNLPDICVQELDPNDPEDAQELLFDMRQACAQDVLPFVAAASVYLQKDGPWPPMVLLLVLWAIEVVLVFLARHKLIETFTLLPALGLLFAWLVTFVSGVACAPVGCTTPTQQGWATF